MRKKIIFWGASGHAKVLREFLYAMDYELIALFDNAPESVSPFLGIPLYHKKEAFLRWREAMHQEKICCLVAIGGARGRDRLEIQEFLKANRVEPAVAVHPTAFVAASATASEGCQILANTSVCADVQMGKACIINTGANVDHESILGNGVHIAPGTTLAGCVTVGDYSLIGPGAVVLPRISIGANTIIGGGAVVTRDIPDGKVAYGNPARIIRDNDNNGSVV